ncbi:hypothetical protein [Calorimonas adulescens]|uniref:Glycosyl transferase n=1 Tax=Calorimonas adulescens TaxID=2606906 RepID=A0A5D8QG04_9THEO|nr:hypothetical protein [Calorimonas adulescens]TZE83431.1 hypothetical protein FWJ32_00660 [Calorimonas adulescens]
MGYIISLVISVIASLVFKPLIRNLLVEKGCVNKNYMGNYIPVGMGLMFIPVVVLSSIPLYFVIKSNSLLEAYIIGIAVMGLTGFIDDVLGDASAKGLKGHISRLLKGELTTGGLKAIMGLLVAVFISVSLSRSMREFIVDTMIITLTTNFLNLLDLRPGRSIKGFLLIILFVVATSFTGNMVIIMPLLCAVLIYMLDDLKANSMLGDTGSNMLGVSAGLIFAAFGSWSAKLIWLVFLIFIHIYTEKYSLSKLIEHNKALRFLDDLGR